MLNSLCVYCGSSPGSRPAYLEAARSVGRLLAENKITLVYGGGSVGLMGAVADAALEAGGQVFGVITEHLMEMEVGHLDLTELHVTKTMHERKIRMAELADGFVALPGGIGTLEELFEVYTWAQLGVHAKPCGILNTDGFYEPLLKMMQHLVDQRFLKEAHHKVLLVESTPDALLKNLQDYQPRFSKKWVH
ncbi:MAG: TIGR00730 family Rossman fold protein [Verrucomicrobiota bacterium]